jgi:hypothetical protein
MKQEDFVVTKEINKEETGSDKLIIDSVKTGFGPNRQIYTLLGWALG